MDPMSQREREIMMLQAWGEIPRRRRYNDMCATIYDEEEEDGEPVPEDV